MRLDDEKQTRLEAIGEQLGIPRPVSRLDRQPYPIDISKPNFHDSKEDFRTEQKTAEKLQDDIKNVLLTLLGERDEPAETEAMRERLSNVRIPGSSGHRFR